MKYILSILFIILSFSAFSQTRFPSVDSAKNYVLRYVKNSAVESFTNWRMQNVNYGTLELLDSLAGNGAIDSIWKSGDTLKYSKFGVNYTIGTVGGTVPTLQQVTTAGNTTTDSLNIKTPLNKLAVSITSVDFSGAENTSGEIKLRNTFDNSYLFLNELGLSNYSSGSALAKELRFTSNRNQYSQISIPDSSGILTQRVAINGTTYNTAANGVVNLGNTDTATVVKAYVTNAESVTITKGQVVYIFGASGDRAAVKLAKNTSDTFSSKTLGIVRADIAAGQAGWITTQGQVSGINLGAYTAGDILWLDSVAGGFTKTKPEAPYHSVFVGVVERANAGNGLIYVKPQNGQELGELHDTKITSPTNNQVLAYTASTGIWENKSVTTALGYTPLNIIDTAAMLNGRLSGITLNTSSAIHTTPVTFSRVGGAWSGSLSLANQTGFTVFRRASGTGTPSFGTIDSSYFGGAFRGQVRANTNDYRRDIDTVPLAVFNVGSAAAGDTAAFSTSTLAGSFYLDGTDTMFITSYRVALQGTSASITPEVWFNDSLNVTAGGTRLATGSAITNLTTGTSVTPTTNKIPPANFVFVRFSAVTTKPTYFTLTLFGYRIRKQ